MSVVIILGIVIFIALIAGGLVWAVREDMKGENKK